VTPPEQNARFVLLAGYRFALNCNEWCERVASALDIGGAMLALTDA
jgi:hypothetical protein